MAGDDGRFQIPRETVLVFAHHLGVNLESESALIDIAEAALNNLPDGWELGIGESGDAQGVPYFFDSKTQQSFWHHPSEELLKRQVRSERENRRGRSSSRKPTRIQVENSSRRTATSIPLSQSKNSEAEIFDGKETRVDVKGELPDGKDVEETPTKDEARSMNKINVQLFSSANPEYKGSTENETESSVVSNLNLSSSLSATQHSSPNGKNNQHASFPQFPWSRLEEESPISRNPSAVDQKSSSQQIMSPVDAALQSPSSATSMQAIVSTAKPNNDNSYSTPIASEHKLVTTGNVQHSSSYNGISGSSGYITALGSVVGGDELAQSGNEEIKSAYVGASPAVAATGLTTPQISTVVTSSITPLTEARGTGHPHTDSAKLQGASIAATSAINNPNLVNTHPTDTPGLAGGRVSLDPMKLSRESESKTTYNLTNVIEQGMPAIQSMDFQAHHQKDIKEEEWLSSTGKAAMDPRYSETVQSSMTSLQPQQLSGIATPQHQEQKLISQKHSEIKPSSNIDSLSKQQREQQWQAEQSQEIHQHREQHQRQQHHQGRQQTETEQISLDSQPSPNLIACSNSSPSHHTTYNINEETKTIFPSHEHQHFSHFCTDCIDSPGLPARLLEEVRSMVLDESTKDGPALDIKKTISDALEAFTKFLDLDNLSSDLLRHHSRVLNDTATNNNSHLSLEVVVKISQEFFSRMFFSGLRHLPEVPVVSSDFLGRALTIFLAGQKAAMVVCLRETRTAGHLVESLTAGKEGGGDIDDDKIPWKLLLVFCRLVGTWLLLQAYITADMLRRHPTTEKELQEVRRLFDALDPTLCGSIPALKVFDLLKSMGEVYTPSEIQLLLETADPGKSGKVEFSNFIAWWCSVAPAKLQ